MRAAAFVLPVVLLGACAALPGARPGAVATLVNGAGSEIGRAEFRGMGGGGVAIRVTAEGLSPGAHGIHIHEQGLCEAPKFTSAGSHLKAPGETDPHGLLHPQGGEAGDLPNLTVGPDGRTAAELTSTAVQVGSAGAMPSVIGRAIVIHALPDDQRSQPTGGSGDRIACGVIRAGS